MQFVKQPDFFVEDAQADLHSEDAAPRAYRPDPNDVRSWLHALLAQARAASTLPWDGARLRLYRTIVPQMTLWLPEAEAAQLRFEFETEILRLEKS